MSIVTGQHEALSTARESYDVKYVTTFALYLIVALLNKLTLLLLILRLLRSFGLSWVNSSPSICDFDEVLEPKTNPRRFVEGGGGRKPRTLG